VVIVHEIVITDFTSCFFVDISKTAEHGVTDLSFSMISHGGKSRDNHLRTPCILLMSEEIHDRENIIEI
jgi:hypothetical protein